MKALSIREPYASLIKEGIKKIETRSFRTKYRGELLIHASKGKSEASDEVLSLLEGEMNPGCILCKCKLVDCVYMDEEYIENIKKNHSEYICGRYEVGRYGWVLEDIEVIEPIPAKGQLGFWNYEWK